MSKLLFEIGTEELPAFYVDEGRDALGQLLSERLNAARLSFDSIQLFSTPRRLAACVHGLATEQPRLETARRGPSIKAGEKAVQGFAKSLGLDPASLTQQDGYFYAQVVEEGQPAAQLLPELLAQVVRDLPANRKMRWGSITDCTFVRPVAWLVALLEDAVLPVQVAGLTAGRSTRGHRFLSPDTFDIISPTSYAEQLRAAYVLANQEERRAAVVQAAEAALLAGQTLYHNDDLRDEIVNLVEYPVGFLGHYDQKYLALPDEVLAETMIVHQRYFPVKQGDALTHAFVVISNNKVPDVSVPMVGYVKVLDGRLSDAKFFWDHDIAKPLTEHRQRLAGMAFQKGLGTLLDKADRVAQLSQTYAQQLQAQVAQVRQASGLFKADVASQMVYEYADLAGVMGRCYAEYAGVPAEVAQLLEDGTFPVTAEARLPRTLEAASLSLADRLDTLVGFFSVGKVPSGSADPFGLRRLGIGAVRVLAAFGIEVPVRDLLQLAADSYAQQGVTVSAESLDQLEAFLWDRFASLQDAAGYTPQQVRAARAVSDHFYAAAWRTALLSNMSGEADFADLAALYKRAANLSKDTEAGEVLANLAEKDSESALIAALPNLQSAVVALQAAAQATYRPWDLAEPAVAAQSLEEAVRAVSAIKPLLDHFFTEVMVMVDQAEVRQNRLNLLAAVRDAVRGLAALEMLA